MIDFAGVVESFHLSLSNSFSNIYLVVILNLFFIFATYTDLKYMKIYDKFNIVMLVTRLITLVIFGFEKDWLLGGLVIFLTYLIIAMYTGDKMAGDIKFGGNIGLWMGFYPSILIVLLSVITNLISRLFTGNKGKVPLAPFLYLAYIMLAVYFFKFV